MIPFSFCENKSCINCDSQGRDLKFSKGQKILSAGSKPKGLYLIKSGLIRLEILSPSGVALTVRIAKANTFFGYRALFSRDDYYYNAIALEDSILCLLPKEKLESAIAKQPALALKIMEQIASDLKESDLRWLAQTTDEASLRVEKAVHFLNSNLPNRNWTKRDIAQLAGTTIETVFRTLKLKDKTRKMPLPQHSQDDGHYHHLNKTL